MRNIFLVLVTIISCKSIITDKGPQDKVEPFQEKTPPNLDSNILKDSNYFTFRNIESIDIVSINPSNSVENMTGFALLESAKSLPDEFNKEFLTNDVGFVLTSFSNSELRLNGGRSDGKRAPSRSPGDYKVNTNRTKSLEPADSRNTIATRDLNGDRRQNQVIQQDRHPLGKNETPSGKQKTESERKGELDQLTQDAQNAIDQGNINLARQFLEKRTEVELEILSSQIATRSPDSITQALQGAHDVANVRRPQAMENESLWNSITSNPVVIIVGAAAISSLLILAIKEFAISVSKSDQEEDSLSLVDSEQNEYTLKGYRIVPPTQESLVSAVDARTEYTLRVRGQLKKEYLNVSCNNDCFVLLP